MAESFGASQVNVAGATSLDNALDLAASVGGKVAAHLGSLDWFQYRVNTYVMEAVNNTNAPKYIPHSVRTTRWSS